MHKIENKRLWKDELTAHSWQKWKSPTKTTVGYSDMREGPVSLLSSHPNKHELEPAELCPVR